MVAALLWATSRASASLARRICTGEGRASAFGSSGHSSAAVSTESTAVSALTAPSSQ